MYKDNYDVLYDHEVPNSHLVSYCQTNYYHYGEEKTIELWNTTPHVSTDGQIRQVKNTYNWTEGGIFPEWHTEPLSQNDYTYDDHGNRLTNTIAISGLTTRTETYTYDDLQRLTGVNYGNGRTQSYTFDPMGNRLQKYDSIDGTENYSYNDVNMLLTRNGQSFVNDPNGNTLSGGGRSNVWDSQNRLVSCTTGGNTTTFTYGADGIRRSMTDSTGTTDFILDGQSVVREKKNGDYKATYLTGPRGIEYKKNDANGAVSWYLYNGLGSVIAEVDNTGAITSTNQNDVYGITLDSSGGTTDHKFVGQLGHRKEAATNGLIYMGARYYDPALGRFISEDPAGNGLNWYTYCNNNPVNLVDPDGKHSDFTTTHSFFWYGVGVGCTLMALLQAAAYPRIGKWKIAVSASISRFANSAITAFGIAQLGRNDLPIATQFVTGYVAAMSWVVGEVITSGARGMRTATAAAVMYSVMLAGTIVGDYVEQVMRY